MRPVAAAMSRDTADSMKGIGKAGADGRERFVRAMMDINFDGDKWLSQFRPGDPLLAKVVLAADAVSPPAAGAQGTALLRQMVLDPVYQRK